HAEEMPQILRIVDQTRALDLVYATAQAELSKARGFVDALKPGPEREALINLCAYSLDRSA
ncbi:MAG: hypothetical protein ACYC22_15195, partial [Thiomonas delicata]